MSTGTKKISYEKGYELIQELLLNLKPFCSKIVPAGSFRRKAQELGDIELVCIPVYKTVKNTADLFGDPIKINPVVEWIEKPGQLNVTRIKGGNKYQRFEFLGVPVDVFMVTEHEFGRQLAMRTGPERYSKKIAARWVQLGYHGVEGQLIHLKSREVAGPFYTEESFFQFLNWEYIKPGYRG